MKEFVFKNNEEEYILSEENLTYVDNEDIDGFEIDEVIELLHEGKEKVDFDYEYYVGACDECKGGTSIDGKNYRFLEYHFYIFTKNNKYVISNISDKFENTSYDQLFRNGEIDDSYIVSILVCQQCKKYNIAIEQCDM